MELTLEQQLHLRNLELSLSHMSDEQKNQMLMQLARLTLEQQNVAKVIIGQSLGITA